MINACFIDIDLLDRCYRPSTYPEFNYFTHPNATFALLVVCFVQKKREQTAEPTAKPTQSLIKFIIIAVQHLSSLDVFQQMLG